MLTKKTTIKELEKRIKELEHKTIMSIPITDFVARKTLFTGDKDYQIEKENLIRRDFKLIKTEEVNNLWNVFAENCGQKEIWEKTYANGEY